MSPPSKAKPKAPSMSKTQSTKLKVKELELLLKKPFSSAEVQTIVAKIAGRSKRVKDGADTCYTYRDAGIELIVNKDRTTTVFLHAESKDTEEYAGELPEDINFKMTPKEVTAALGDADDEDNDVLFVYDRGLYRLYVEFEDAAMTLVTLTTNTPS